jgi:hypothetical protein
METKRIIPVKKLLNGELAEPLLQKPENMKLHNQQREKCNNGTMLG